MTDIPGNSSTTAVFEGNPLDMATYSGELETFGDHDWIKFTVNVPSAGFGIPIYAFGCVNGVVGDDSTIVLRDANGNLVNSNDDAGGTSQNSFCASLLTTSGTYYLDISSANGPPGDYSLVLMGVESLTRLGVYDDNFTDNGNDLIVGDDREDFISLENAGMDALGEHGEDWIHGDNGRNRISGGLGDDQIYAIGGDDLLFGDEGHDRITAGAVERGAEKPLAAKFGSLFLEFIVQLQGL